MQGLTERGVIVLHSFTPLQHPADDPKSDTITTHFDYRSLGSLIRLDILGCL